LEAKKAIKENKRDQIIRATMELISSEGVAAVTHKAVAKRAGVSLAATTYYFKTKDEFLIEAIQHMMGEYATNMDGVLSRQMACPSVGSFSQLISAYLRRGIGKYRQASIAWAEIMNWLVRREEYYHLVRDWYLDNVPRWDTLVEGFGLPNPTLTGINATDTISGVLEIFQITGKTEADFDRIFRDGENPLEVLVPDGGGEVELTLPGRVRRKSQKTRGKVLAAAQEILAEGGIQALTHKAVAQRSGLTVAVPTYHFASKSTLLSATYRQLMADARDRYREVMGKVDYSTLTIATMIDLTALIVQAEITQHSHSCLVQREIGLLATREPSLRSTVWAFSADQIKAWSRLLECLGYKTDPLDAFLVISLLSGKMRRHIALGSQLGDLISLREELTAGINSILDKSHWAIQYADTRNTRA